MEGHKATQLSDITDLRQEENIYNIEQWRVSWVSAVARAIHLSLHFILDRNNMDLRELFPNPNDKSRPASPVSSVIGEDDVPADSPRPGCLQWSARCLGSRWPKILAGAGLTGGVIAMALLGPGAIPVLVIAVSFGIYCLSTTTSLAIREPDDSILKVLQCSVFDFLMVPLVPVAIALAFIYGFLVGIYDSLHDCVVQIDKSMHPSSDS